MKIPLRYQVSEYDCGQTSLINALNYLFEREEIPVTIIRIINKYTLDTRGKNNIKGELGTSKKSISKIFNLITKKYNFNISYEILNKENVKENKIRKCLNDNGCILARCYLQLEHYILITKIDNNYVYIFDPYYVEEDYYNDDDSILIVLNKNNTYNRVVKIDRLFEESYNDYSLMQINKRQIVLINRNEK